MKRLIAAMAAALLIVLPASASFAQMGIGVMSGHGMGGNGMGNRGMGGHGPSRDAEASAAKQAMDMATAVPDFLLIDLNLTRDQSAQIKALRDGFLKEIQPLQEEVFAKRLKFNELRAGTPKQEQVEAMQYELKGITQRIMGRTVKYVQSVRRVLSPEQRSMLRHYWLAWDGGYIIPKE